MDANEAKQQIKAICGWLREERLRQQRTRPASGGRTTDLAEKFARKLLQAGGAYSDDGCPLCGG